MKRIECVGKSESWTTSCKPWYITKKNGKAIKVTKLPEAISKTATTIEIANQIKHQPGGLYKLSLSNIVLLKNESSNLSAFQKFHIDRNMVIKRESNAGERCNSDQISFERFI